jgi:uridine phosphorylase
VLASLLDDPPKPFELYSERGFLTITGRYHGTPVSIISIGMGYPNMDFFVREVRECLLGDMAVVRSFRVSPPCRPLPADTAWLIYTKRLGSCGALTDIPVGSAVIPKASISVTRNVDFDFVHGESKEAPYRISQPVRRFYL